MARLAKRIEAVEKALQATGRGQAILLLPWDDEPAAEELAQYEYVLRLQFIDPKTRRAVKYKRLENGTICRTDEGGESIE